MKNLKRITGRSNMAGFFIVIILCVLGSFSTAVLHHYGFEYAHIACIYLVVVWANVVANRIELDMDK